MNHQDTAQALALQHNLSAQAAAQLLQWAAPPPQAHTVRLWFWRVVAVLAAGLGGFGIVMWVAANWESFGRFGRFALLQITVLVMCVGASTYLRRNARVHGEGAPVAASAMGLVALLCIGALFAYFGQTYQTGADPWQLFALWAVLALPLCLALRSDIVWTPWVMVAATGIALWLQAHSQHSWRVQPDNFRAHLVACVMGLAMALTVGPLLRRWTGAGPHSLRVAVTLNVLGLVVAGVAGLFSRYVAPQYLLALVVALGGSFAFTRLKLFDVYTLSVFALGAIVLLLTGLARLMFEGATDWIGAFFILALVAAGLLTGAVRVILHLNKQQQATMGGAA
jgi:uncharacterized membrane protein